MPLPAFAASSLISAGSAAATGATAAGATAAGATAIGGSKGMSPILAKILADAGGGLLQGIGAGLGGKQSVKQWEKMATARKKFFDQNLKPQGQYYQGYKNMNRTDWLITNLLLGNLEQHLGTDLLKKWGIDIPELKDAFNLESGPQYYGETRVPVNQIQPYRPSGQITPGSLRRPR